MTHKCKSCGAKLNIKKNQAEVKCNYCGTYNKIEYTQSDFLRDSSKRSKKIIIISMILFLAPLLFFLPKLISNKSIFSIFTGGSGGSLTAKETIFHNCLPVNFNDDDVLDLIGTAEKYDISEKFVIVVNGKTGEIEKEIEFPRNKDPKIGIVPEKYVFLGQSDFSLTFYSQKLEKIKTFSLSDVIDDYEIVGNKLLLETEDYKKWIIDLDSLKIRNEDFEFNQSKLFYYKQWVTDGTNSYINEIKGKHIKNLYNIIKINSDTLPKTPDDIADKYGSYSRFTVGDSVICVRKQNGKIIDTIPDPFTYRDYNSHIDTLWTLPMSYSSVGADFQIAVAEQNIFTAGEKYTSDNFTYLIAVDKTDGIIKFEKKICEDRISINNFLYNNKYIIITIRGAIFAYDPSNGDLVWKTDFLYGCNP